MKVDIDVEKFKVDLSFQESDFYSLDTVLAIVIHASLVKYKEHSIEKGMGHPGPLSTLEEWYEILDKIILAFDTVVNDTQWQYDGKKSYKVKEGLHLFAEWYGWLWT